MVDSYYVIFIRDWLEFSIAMVSLFCSFFTIYIIYRLKAWNGNILLITTLTCFQMLYDINFLFGPSGYYSTCVIWNFLDLLGGLGTSFTTNAIAFTMIYTVVRIRSINIIKNYHYIFLIVGIIPLTIAVLMLFIIVHASRDDDRPYTDCVYNFSPLALFIQEFYYWSRLASIIFNFVAFWYISFKIKRLGFVQSLLKFIASTVSAHLSSTNSDLSTDVTGTAAGVIGAGGITGVIDQPMLTIADQQTLAVKILVSRMRFYPLAQAICRSGSAWDEFENYKYSNNTSSLMASICSPLSGVFYMIIFLVSILYLILLLDCFLCFDHFFFFFFSFFNRSCNRMHGNYVNNYITIYIILFSALIPIKLPHHPLVHPMVLYLPFI